MKVLSQSLGTWKDDEGALQRREPKSLQDEVPKVLRASVGYLGEEGDGKEDVRLGIHHELNEL